MKWGVVLVVLLCAAALLPGLTGTGPFDTLEARDMEVARELIAARTGSATPLFAESLLEKPPFAYAPELLAQTTAPARPLAASRAWRVVVACLLVLLTGATTARHLGGRAGICAAAVLASSLTLPLAARLDGTQLLAALFAWIAVDGITHVWFAERGGRNARLVICYASLACAAAVAGPLSALWPLGAAAIYQRLTRRRDAWRELRPVLGLAAILALATPWYVVMTQRHGAGFLLHALCFPYGLSDHRAWYLAPFMTVSFVIVGFFPWSAMLPGALQHAAVWWRRTRRGPDVADESIAAEAALAPLARELNEERAAHWFIACAIAALVPLLFYPRAPLTAVLPALPALAALCGRLLDHVIEDQARAGLPVFRATQMLSMTGSVAAILLMMVASRTGDAAPAFRLLATALFATAWLPFLAGLTGRFRLAALLMLLPVAVCMPIACFKLVPAAEGYLTARPFAVAIERSMPPAATLALFDDAPASLLFLSRHPSVRAHSLEDAYATPRATDGYVYLAYRPSHEAEMRKVVATHEPRLGALEVLARTPGLVLARIKA